MKLSDSEKQKETGSNAAPMLPSCRLVVALMCCFALVILGLLRSNLSISLVCMVSKSPAAVVRSFSANESVPFRNETNAKGEFQWNRQYQGFLLSAYFYGYLATQLISGLLAGKLGAKHVLGTSVLIAAAATLLSPPVARFSPELFIFLRAVVGAGTGCIYSSIQALMGIWAPPLERSILSAITFSGLNIGYMLAFLISSQFCQIPYDNGWPLTFYVTGGASVLFWILWNAFVFSSPEQHPRISDKELTYIKSTTGLKTQKSNERKPFPWRKAVRDPAVIALLIVQTSHTWFSYSQVTSVALYLRDVLQFDIKQNGLFMILPYLLVFLSTYPLGFIADIVRRRKVLSTASVRKLFQSISSFGSVILISIIGFLDHDSRYAAVTILMIMTVVNNVGRFGFLINPQDIAPRYSGEIFGIVNTAASVSGILAPIAVGQLTPHGTQYEWRIIFLMSAAVFFVGGLVFAIFAKGEPLPWARDDAVETNKTGPRGSAVSPTENINRGTQLQPTSARN